VIVDRCSSTTKDGTPCGAAPRPGRSFCPWHDPQLVTARQTWRARGGQGKSSRRRATRNLADAALTMPEVAGLLSVALKKVATGTMEPGVGNAMANIARALVATQQAGDVEMRLAELEAVAGIPERGRA
jgi:hypothetical protein